VRLFTDPQVARWFNKETFTEEEIERILWQEGAHWDEHGFGPWTVRQDGVFAGRAGLQWTVVDDEPVVEVLWAIVPSMQRRGIATEAALLAIEWARQIGLPEVVAFTLRSNEASQCVMQKAGMTYVGMTTHADLPHVLYRLKL
jgi:ribosomal-protein-alanine N-acetyltransferase